MMAFLLAGLVLVSSLLPGFGVDQSAKLIDLIQHFQEHRQTEPQLSFLDFMAMHYGENSEHQKHPNHSHHNLPAAGHTVSVFAPVPSPFLLLLSLPVLLLAQSACFDYANLYSFLNVSSLIYPPRRY